MFTFFGYRVYWKGRFVGKIKPEGRKWLLGKPVYWAATDRDDKWLGSARDLNTAFDMVCDSVY